MKTRLKKIEKNLKRLILLFFIIFIVNILSGCATVEKNYPPLKDGEIPFKLEDKIYKDSRGLDHIVNNNNPRWAISEVMMFDIASNPNLKNSNDYNHYNTFKIVELLIICLASIILIVSIFFYSAKLKL